jgi:hypothetical protein
MDFYRLFSKEAMNGQYEHEKALRTISNHRSTNQKHSKIQLCSTRIAIIKKSDYMMEYHSAMKRK